MILNIKPIVFNINLILRFFVDQYVKPIAVAKWLLMFYLKCVQVVRAALFRQVDLSLFGNIQVGWFWAGAFILYSSGWRPKNKAVLEYQPPDLKKKEIYFTLQKCELPRTDKAMTVKLLAKIIFKLLFSVNTNYLNTACIWNYACFPASKRPTRLYPTTTSFIWEISCRQSRVQQTAPHKIICPSSSTWVSPLHIRLW